MNCENGVITEISQTEKDNAACVIPRIRAMKVVQFLDTESKKVVPGTGQGKTGCYCLMGSEFRFGNRKIFWRWFVVMVALQHDSIQYH